MLKRTYTILVAAFLVLGTLNTFSQSISIGVGGGLTQVTGAKEYITEVMYGGKDFVSEYNFGAMGKIDIPLIPITPRVFALYHKFTGNGLISAARVKYSQSILSLGVGASYSFIPIPTGTDPYIALDVMYNSYGDFTTTKNGNETKVPKDSRTGIGVGIGAEITILPIVNLDVSASYRVFNLIGKEDGEKTLSAINLDVFVMFSLL